MNDVQAKIIQLQERGWTLVALADKVGITVNAVEKWKAGERKPANPKATSALMDHLLSKKRISKKRRYMKGARLLPKEQTLSSPE